MTGTIDESHADEWCRRYNYDDSFRKTHTQPAIGYAGKPKPYLRTEQAGGRYDREAKPRTNCEVWKAYERLPDPAVREAVKRNVPRTGYEFEARLCRLARHLRSAYPRDGVNEWREVVGVWYFLARPCDKSKTLDDVWAKFAAAHQNADGRSPGWKLRQIANDHGSADPARTLAAVARHLKRRTLFVSARTFATWIGTSVATAARRLTALVLSGAVRVLAAGKPHVFDRTATAYDVSPLFALSDRQPDTPQAGDNSFTPMNSGSLLCLNSGLEDEELTDDEIDDDDIAIGNSLADIFGEENGT